MKRMKDKLMAALQRSGLKDKELAKAIGKSESLVSKWFKEEQRNPALGDLYTISKVLNVSLDYLFNDQATTPFKPRNGPPRRMKSMGIKKIGQKWLNINHIAFAEDYVDPRTRKKTLLLHMAVFHTTNQPTSGLYTLEFEGSEADELRAFLDSSLSSAIGVTSPPTRTGDAGESVAGEQGG
jgi:transcriptional regulator with XRE-family HTH domain